MKKSKVFFTMPPQKSRSNAVWEHYENFRDTGKAMCKICKTELKNNRISNLKTHLLKIHKININNEVSSNSSDSLSDIRSSISNRRHNIGVLHKRSNKVAVHTHSPFNNNIEVQINRKILFRSYIGLVTEDSVSFNVLNSQNFKNLIDPICEGFREKYGKRITLNGKNCEITLNKVAENIRASMKNEMCNRLLSLKIDSASRLSRNIFGISAQFIKEDDITSIILGMVELKGFGASASNNLAAEILKTLQKYGIHLNQVVSITSANMIKTSKILSTYSLNEEPELTEEDSNNTYLKNINDLEKPSNLRVEHIQICGCAAHTAQLCALDVIKDTDIKGFLLSCRNLTKFIRKSSNGLTDAFELRGLTIPLLDCSTRWGSTYEMISTLLDAKDALVAVESVGNKSIEENFDNTDVLWDFMESYRKVFGPLQETIIQFQAEHLHCGNFYAQWLKCKILTSRIVETNTNGDLLTKIGRKLLESIEKRTSKLLENESLNACLFLDPRFHHTLTSDKRQEAVLYLKNLWEKLQSVSSATERSFEDNSAVAVVISEHDFHDEAEEMLNSFLTDKLKTTTSERVFIDVHSKIANLHLPFTRCDTNILLYWKERKHSDPELYALSNVCFGVPSTQVTIESAFSSLKLILTDNRNRMSHETLEDILLVKLNSTFLNDAINNLPLFEDAED